MVGSQCSTSAMFRFKPSPLFSPGVGKVFDYAGTCKWTAMISLCYLFGPPGHPYVL